MHLQQLVPYSGKKKISWFITPTAPIFDFLFYILLYFVPLQNMQMTELLHDREIRMIESRMISVSLLA